jgi:hypothetical protein
MDFTGQYNAAWMLMEKTPAIVHLIEDYLKGVSDFHFVSDEESNLENIPAFLENRHDQSILSLILKCRYLENGLERFTPLLPGKKARIHMLSIVDHGSSSTSTERNTSKTSGRRHTRKFLWTMMLLLAALSTFYSLA